MHGMPRYMQRCTAEWSAEKDGQTVYLRCPMVSGHANLCRPELVG